MTFTHSLGWFYLSTCDFILDATLFWIVCLVGMKDCMYLVQSEPSGLARIHISRFIIIVIDVRYIIIIYIDI